MRTYTYKKLIIFEDPANFERTYYLEGMDNDDWLQVINRHNSFRVWTESVAVPDDDDETSLMDAFDTKLTPYTSTVTLGDHTFPVGEYRMHPDWSKMENKSIYEPTDEGWKRTPITTADPDARDHFASEVRALHPTQLDRIEEKLRILDQRLNNFLDERP